MNIRLKPKVEEKKILLGDCDDGDVVKLASGATALVVYSAGAVINQYVQATKAIIVLFNGDGSNYFEVGCGIAENAIHGTGSGRIVEIIGKLVQE